MRVETDKEECNLEAEPIEGHCSDSNQSKKFL
jgi:hypothetical protein